MIHFRKGGSSKNSTSHFREATAFIWLNWALITVGHISKDIDLFRAIISIFEGIAARPSFTNFICLFFSHSNRCRWLGKVEVIELIPVTFRLVKYLLTVYFLRRLLWAVTSQDFPSCARWRRNWHRGLFLVKVARVSWVLNLRFVRSLTLTFHHCVPIDLLEEFVTHYEISVAKALFRILHQEATD